MLYMKNIRNQRYLYFGEKEASSVSLGKLEDVLQLSKLRIANKARDKYAVIQVLRLLGRDNLANFLDLSPKELDIEFNHIKIKV